MIPLLFVSLFTTILYAQSMGKIIIGVMDLDASGLSVEAKKALSDRLRTELFNTGRFSVMERNKMDEILKEQGFQQTGCTSNECVVEAGRLLGVDRMISGSVGKVGAIYTVSLRMIDIETGRIMLTKTEDCNCPIEKVLTTSLRNVALKMAGLSSDSKTMPVVRKETVAGFGDFYFKSEPAGATVFIDDQPVEGVTPLMKESVPAGTHQIRMKKGYYSGSQTVFLEPNEFKRVEMTLSRAKGSLKIISYPLEADIFLDNKSIGNTPQTLSNLDAGEHRLKLTKPGFMDHEQIVLIDGGKLKRLTINLEKIKAASLKITSRPADCNVYIDKQYKGKTPVAVHDLMPGPVTVKLTHPMHNDWQQTISLGNGEIKEIQPALTKKTGKLVIKSDPVGADVAIDGVRKGMTPLLLSAVEYGTHTVTIFKTNYQPGTEKIKIVSADGNEIFSRLILAKGALSVTGTPAGAAIVLNDRLIGSLPLTNYQADGGSYALTVNAKGYEKYKQPVTLSPNQTTSVHIKLVKKTNRQAVVRSLFIPGSGQGYLEKKGRAVLFPFLEIGAISGALLFNNKFHSAVADYNDARERYTSAVEQTEIDRYYHQMETHYDEIESAERMRTVFIGAAVGVWLWNVVDAALFGPETDKNVRVGHIERTKVKLSALCADGKKLVGFTYKF